MDFISQKRLEGMRELDLEGTIGPPLRMRVACACGIIGGCKPFIHGIGTFGWPELEISPEESMGEFREMAQALEWLLRVNRTSSPGAPNPDEILGKLIAYLESEDMRRERSYADFEKRLQSLSAALQDFLTRADERKELGRELVGQRVLTMRWQRENAQLREENTQLAAQLADLRRHFDESEADRAARLKVIEEQGGRLGTMEAERNDLAAQLADLRRHFDESEADRAARLEVIQEQDHLLNNQRASIRDISSFIRGLEKSRLGRLLYFLRLIDFPPVAPQNPIRANGDAKGAPDGSRQRG